MDLDLTDDERIIYRLLSKTMLKPISEIAPYVPFGKSKTTQLLKKMNKKGIVVVEGKGRGTIIQKSMTFYHVCDKII